MVWAIMAKNNVLQKQVIRFLLTDVSQRLDHTISIQCDQLSRTAAKKIIDIGGVHVAGKRVRTCSSQASLGAKVEIFIDGLPLNYYRISVADIVYQDKYLIVINKPATVETQPTPARYKGTLYEALLLWLQDKYRPHLKPTIGMVQRLDRDTSGVMVFSTHQLAHKGLTQIFTQRLVRKTYLAVVSGILDAEKGEFSSDLARNRATNKMKSVEKGGKLAITRYELVQQFSSCALVQIEILTGRMHQIRAQFSESGHPLVGDSRYGYDSTTIHLPIKRTMLHSWKLNFEHPVTKQQLDLLVDPPDDIKQLLTHLGYSDNVALSKY